MSYQFGQIDPEERPVQAEVAQDDEMLPRRRGVPVGVLALVVMAVFAGGLAFAYYAGTQHASVPRREVPLIRPAPGATKVKPVTPGGMAVPDQNNLVYEEKPGGPGPGVERLLPPAEQPMPRPAAPPAEAAPSIPAPVAVAPRQELLKPVAPGAAQPRAAEPKAVPKPKPRHRPPPREETRRAAGTPVRIQLGSMRSEEQARDEWGRLKRLDGDLLGHLSAVSVRTDLGARGIYYLIQAGPVADKAVAERLCGALKERKVGCLIVR